MLFSDTLLFLTAEKTAFEKASGAFARKVGVLILEESGSAANRDFLEKVLLAAQLKLTDDTLLAEIPAAELCQIAPDLQEKKPEYLLVFGIPPTQLGLSIAFHPYQVTHFYGCNWLFADKLSTLSSDVAKKKLLWTALQKMFL